MKGLEGGSVGGGAKGFFYRIIDGCIVVTIDQVIVCGASHKFFFHRFIFEREWLPGGNGSDTWDVGIGTDNVGQGDGSSPNGAREIVVERLTPLDDG